MKYYICEGKPKGKYNASTKARQDVEVILESLKYKSFFIDTINGIQKNKLLKPLQLITYIKNRLSRDKKKDRAIENAVQALLRNELIRRYREYEEKGEISILDKENITHMYEEYKNLGGNGTVEKLYSELLDLHTKIVK